MVEMKKNGEEEVIQHTLALPHAHTHIFNTTITLIFKKVVWPHSIALQYLIYQFLFLKSEKLGKV